MTHHPQRCDTCRNNLGVDSKGKINCNVSAYNQYGAEHNWINKYQQYHINTRGCASYCSAASDEPELFLITLKEIGELIELTEDMCIEDKMSKCVKIARKRIDLINGIKTRKIPDIGGASNGRSK